MEHDQGAFLAGVPAFVEQVQDVDSINLFLTSIGYVSPGPWVSAYWNCH